MKKIFMLAALILFCACRQSQNQTTLADGFYEVSATDTIYTKDPGPVKR